MWLGPLDRSVPLTLGVRANRNDHSDKVPTLVTRVFNNHTLVNRVLILPRAPKRSTTTTITRPLATATAIATRHYST